MVNFHLLQDLRLNQQIPLPSLKSWSLKTQTAEMEMAGLDSSHLSPYLPEPDLDPPHMFPLVGSVDLDPHSEEYF